jgi:hypothetical protein
LKDRAAAAASTEPAAWDAVRVGGVGDDGANAADDSMDVQSDCSMLRVDCSDNVARRTNCEFHCAMNS